LKIPISFGSVSNKKNRIVSKLSKLKKKTEIKWFRIALLEKCTLHFPAFVNGRKFIEPIYFPFSLFLLFRKAWLPHAFLMYAFSIPYRTISNQISIHTYITERFIDLDILNLLMMVLF